ncbi:hypothetical protein PWT90_06370 [Aphanocladium album]|nr:hypothetical protein PWT90_06370 [Aphanocladium album]
MEPLLKGYNAFITGAGSGIGKCTAIHFARHGVTGLAIADINKAGLAEVAAIIGKEFPQVKVLPLDLDVTSITQVKSAIAQTVKKFGRLDVAVNNAGILGKNQLTHTLPEEEWRRVLDVNINSVFYCHKEQLRVMKKQEYAPYARTASKPANSGDRDLGPRRGRGTIINTASVAGLRAVMIPIYQSAYVTTKHGKSCIDLLFRPRQLGKKLTTVVLAVVGLTKADAISYSPYNIRINAICPGYVATPLIVTDEPENEVGLQILKDNVPLNRLVLPEEIADGIVFLASQLSSGMQASTLSVDLGLSTKSATRTCARPCDESRPACSRCQKQETECKYVSVLNEEDDVTATEGGYHSSIGYNSMAADSNAHLASTTDQLEKETTEGSPHWRSPMQLDTPKIFSENNAGSFSLLSSRELELFSHYITHTSHVIPSDQADLFALHVGVPNLALTMPAVMGSVIALSAACKCYDILKTRASPLEYLEEMRELLALADRHHQRSLGQLQEAISRSNFNAVLANAALMVLYALSGHWVRVLLATKAQRVGKSLPEDVLPAQSQWITSIRAAYVAHVGLQERGSTPGPQTPSDNTTLTEAGESRLLDGTTTENGDSRYKPEDGPSDETKRLVLPIVSATYQAALEKLRLRCEHAQQMSLETDSIGMGACLSSLELLERLYRKVLGTEEISQETSLTQSGSALAHGYPWLARYIARVTSAVPSKMSRRTTTAFLNRVPIEYLQLVQSALDCMPIEAELSDSSYHGQDITLTAAHKPAMDIFAHWLILVMLLDGVWWIGDIGSWELARILRFTESRGWLPELSSGGTWWPQTMHALKATLAGTK